MAARGRERTSKGTAATKRTTPAREPPGRSTNGLGPNGEILALQLTKVAVRTIYAGIVREESLLQRVKANEKWTEEFSALTQMDVPDEVRAWVEKHFWNPGTLRDAVQSQVRIALEHAQAQPGDHPREKFDAVPRKIAPREQEGEVGVRFMHSCDPWCGAP